MYCTSSGGRLQLVVGGTRRAARRDRAVTVVIDALTAAMNNPLAASAVGMQHAGVEPSLADHASEDARWRQWKVKGRADDARFGRRVRTIVVDAAAVVALGGALWFAFLM